MTTQQHFQPWASLVGYNQLPPIYLRLPSRCCRPAFCLVGPLVAAGVRVVRWAVARAGCLGPRPGAVGGGWRFCGQLPPTPPPPPIVYFVGAVSRPLPRWAPLLRCPAPAVAPRAGCALAAVCWVGGAIGWPAVASGSALYYYTLHLLYLSL